MKKLQWTDSEFDGTYFLFNIIIGLHSTTDLRCLGKYGLMVKAVRFPDDQAEAMVSRSNAGLQRIIDALNKMSNDYVTTG